MRISAANKDYDTLGENVFYFLCPGCKTFHSIPTSGSRAWKFNNDMDKPTFSPSILVKGYRFISKAADNDETEKFVCHSFVTDGRISFCSDSTHSLSGQTVDLAEVEP
ncbi:MAG: DUF6527 family protein [Bdellovibrionales bacterium]